MNKVTIERNSNGDTRTADHAPTIEEFDVANGMHHCDVHNMMSAVADEIKRRGDYHDHTKIAEPYRSEFYKDLTATIEGRMNFEDGKWYQEHCKKERHHLNKHCPDDVNLIDVIEMICDCVCAGMARSGEYRPINLSPDILVKAFKNTEKLLVESVKLTDKNLEEVYQKVVLRKELMNQNE